MTTLEANVNLQRWEPPDLMMQRSLATIAWRTDGIPPLIGEPLVS